MDLEFDLQDLQSRSLCEMLRLSDDDEGKSLKTWKVLIYDDESRRIISPILRIGELRRQGVTLNLNLSDRREPLPGVDAVYLVTPTEDNVNLILSDAREKKYSRVHLNFTTYTSDVFLSDFARRFAEINAFNSVASVTDRYLHFISLSPVTFSLNLPSAFRTFYGETAEELSNSVLETVVDRLLSVLVTSGALPYVRAPRTNSPANTVAQRLCTKLHELVSSRNALGPTYNRPLCIILDRTVDLSTMIQHSWNYQPLLHDLFGIDNNKVAIPGLRKSFDLENSDKIYQAILSLPLSDVAMYISNSLEYYNSQITQINKSDDSGNLVNAINAIPQLTEQKRLLDMHTNIATTLVDTVKQREIDRFYEFEYDLDIMYDKNSLQAFEDLINNHNATPMDKYRSLLILNISKPHMSDEIMNDYEERIKKSGLKCEGLRGLRSLMRMQDFSSNLMKHIQSAVNQSVKNQSPNPTVVNPMVNQKNENVLQTKPEPSQAHKKLANYSSKLIGTGYNLFKGVRNLLPRKKNLHIVKIVEDLINNSESISEDFVFFDPKTSDTPVTKSTKRITSKKCFVFVVGGASYNESLAIADLASKLKHTMIYGSTYFDRPEDFVTQLGSFNFNL
ncbi:Sec1 family protein [Theileria parva strain Muguga]|uniref:Sec1 family protein n=1 Tax=Theileria parva strain Muguga TaxID=333668 RepID=UPI001C61A8AC|nr:Sec1 family protein [Theileria parva strain Muguga]KAF5153220.1 Sec1 family protein [Theileria parva strain Muguga]